MVSDRGLSVRSILNSASYALVLLAGMAFMLNSVMLAPTPMGIVTSGSMRPTLGLGDIVFIYPAALRDVRIGEIIAFYAPPDENTVIHRVVGRSPEGKYLITKGDANPVTDQEVGGWLGVDGRRLIGRVYCLDSQPLRVPLIGLYVLAAKNFSIWLTQNKIWSFWAPLLAILFIFGPYLSPRGLGQLSLRRSLRVRVPVRAAFTYSLVAFVAISAFTLYFRTEVYTLGMRVACLEDFPDRRYVSFGSMIYGETKNNSIGVTGPPLLPVKTLVLVTENASKLVTPIPSSARIEPDSLNDLILQASIPARGEVEPGLYGGRVYILSDTLLLLLPDAVIFPILHLIPNPWVAVFLLDALVALTLASLLASVAAAINWASRQALYTLVWREKLDIRFPRAWRVKVHHFARRAGAVSQRFAARLERGYSVVRREVKLGGVLRTVCLAAVPAAVLFLLRDNLLLPVVTLGLALGFLVKRKRRKGEGELVFSAVLANLLVSVAFVVRNAAVFLYSPADPYWCAVSASFVGDVSHLATLPIAVSIAVLSFFGLEWTRVWYLEQQTSNWQFARPGETPVEKTITIPSLEEFEGRVRRRLAIPEVRGLGRALAAVRTKARETLAKFLKRLGCWLGTLWVEAHVAALSLREMETGFIGREEAFLKFFGGLRLRLRTGLERIRVVAEDSRWVLRWLGYRLNHGFRRLRW